MEHVCCSSQFSVTTVILQIRGFGVSLVLSKSRGRTVLTNDQAHSFQDTNLLACKKKNQKTNKQKTGGGGDANASS